MTFNEWLQISTKKLAEKNISSARLDCLIILELVLKIDRTKILAELNTELEIKQILLLNQFLNTRIKQTPIAYLTKKVEFYGRDFYVDQRVLIPRPESELIVELAKQLVINLNKPIQNTHNSLSIKTSPNEYKAINKYLEKTTSNGIIQLADVGCGSGNLGISISLELPKTTVDLIDNSLPALQVTKINVAKYSTDNLVIESYLLNNTSKDYQIIIANLPYVPDGFPISESAKFEPKHALYAGNDGLKYYRELFNQLSEIKIKPLYIIIEKMPILDTRLAELTKHSSYKTILTSRYVNAYQLML